MPRNFICSGCGGEIFDIRLRKSTETRCLICRDLGLPEAAAAPPPPSAPQPEAPR